MSIDTSAAPATPGTGSTAEVSAGAADPRRWLALAVIAAASLMVVLDISIVNVALPHVQAGLHISDADRQWVVTAYTLAFGGLLLLGGRIADFVGRKRILLIGLIGFAGASALGGLAVNAAMLFGARALQGAFAALLAPAALSLIAVTFVESRERARAFGVYGAVQGGGGASGLILGGVLTEYASWRWCLFVNVPIALAAALAALPTVRESRADGDRHYDVPGAILITAGLVALVYGCTEAARDGVGWLAAPTLGLLAAAVALLVAFVVVEAWTAHPLLPPRVVADRNRGGSFIASLLIGAGMLPMFLFLAYYFQVNLGYTPLTSGLAVLPFSGGIIATAMFAAALLPRVGPKPLMVVGMSMGTAGLFWLTRLDASSSWVWGVLPSEIVMSVGLGLVFVPLSSVALFGIAPRDAGVASALLNTTQQVGGVLGVALLNTLYASAVASYLTAHRPGPAGARAVQLAGFLYGDRIAFIVGGCLLAAALLVIIVLIDAKTDTAPSG
jgi:EmrB/QacA subfamily drug resistance transporter